jgi:hypothetical protein
MCFPWRSFGRCSLHGPRQRKGLEEIAFSDSWEKAWGTMDLGDLLPRQDLLNRED